MDQPIQQFQGPKPQFTQPGISGMPTGTFQMSGMPQSRPMQLGQMGMRPGMQNMHKPMMSIPNIGFDEDEKRRVFSKGVYVSGFEKTLTFAMLYDYFSKVKNVHGIKFPYTKLNESKGFAFVYFGSQDDAKQVRNKLDRTAILKSKIRVTRTVISDHLSKMMFKLKFEGLKPEEIEAIEKNYFNDENLEKEVEKIIKPIFNDSIEINKIIIPCSKKEEKQLKYARVFFYISNLKEAYSVAKRMDQNTNERPDRNEYDIILNYIMKTLNKHQVFSKYCKAELYEYTKKNQTNVLHIKGIKCEDQSQEKLTEEIKEFIQSKNPQWNIKNCYAAKSEKGAWANVTFENAEEATQAFQAIKNQRAKFRDVAIYANLKNVKDNRTVVLSAINNEVTAKEVHKFLTEAATSSGVIEMNNPEKGRKYDFFSFNIIEKKTFYITNQGKTVSTGENIEIQESWREMNTVPRRIIVHFVNDITDEQIRDLTLFKHLKTTSGFKDIFIDGNKKMPFRANHQKGHIKNDTYIPHIEKKSNKPKRVQNMSRPPRNNMPRPHNQHQNQNQNQFHGGRPTQPKIDFSSLKMDAGGIPKNLIPSQGRPGGIPLAGVQQQRFQQMGGNNSSIRPMNQQMGGPIPIGSAPNRSQIPGPGLGNRPPPLMGGLPPMGGIPTMGSIPSMGGFVKPPTQQKDEKKDK